MDEASSRFVDKIALEKLLNDKLLRVRHKPSIALEHLEGNAFARLPWSQVAPVTKPGPIPEVTLLRSALAGDDSPDEWYPVCEYAVPNPRGAILLVHGLYEDNRAIYGFTIGELNRLSYSVYLTTLPYHYERIPEGSAYSGEYFFSADLARTKAAFCQACIELDECHGWLRSRVAVPTFVVGFSMGGTVALSVAVLRQRFRAVTLINPAACLLDVIWTSPLCQSIKRDLIDAGHQEPAVSRVVASFDPYALIGSGLDQDRVQMIYALYDQITLPSQYEALIRRLNLLHVHRYKAGHLNTLRVPRLAEDIATFCERVACASGSRKESLG